MGRPWYEHILYPEWMLHNEDYDDIRRQEAKTSSLEHRVSRLEDQVRDLQLHIRGLEALLAANGIVPLPMRTNRPPKRAAASLPYSRSGRIIPSPALAAAKDSGATGTCACSASCRFCTKTTDFPL